MKNNDELYETVVKLLVEELNIDKDQIQPESDIMDDLGGDSLQAVELVMIMEDEFDITIDDDAVGRVHTVGDLHREVSKIING